LEKERELQWKRYGTITTAFLEERNIFGVPSTPITPENLEMNKETKVRNPVSHWLY
jgi:hypothetical protein